MNYILNIMENYIEQIIEILNKTENDLQKVIVEAAQARDYRSVDIARASAVSIQNLRTQISNSACKVEQRSAKSASGVRRKALSRKGNKSGYPKFRVMNDTLLRIGWSKKQRREYVHKAPKFVFDKTTKAMATLAQNGAGPFMAEQIIEQISSMESDTIPSYQVYVVIGLLRKTNCIKQVGREGYDIQQDILEKARDVWRSLASK